MRRRRRGGVVLAVTDQHAAHTEGGGEGGEEEVDTVIEEISGLSSLHIKPRVVISDSKTKTSTAIQTTQIKEREPSSSSEGNGLIDRRRLCSVYAELLLHKLVLFFFFFI